MKKIVLFLRKYLGGPANLLWVVFLIVDLVLWIVNSSAVCYPFKEANVYVTLAICIVFGIFSWRDMQTEDGLGPAIFMIICVILLPLILWFAYHNWWVNILGFYLFVMSGFIAVMEMKPSSEKTAVAHS